MIKNVFSLVLQQHAIIVPILKMGAVLDRIIVNGFKRFIFVFLTVISYDFLCFGQTPDITMLNRNSEYVCVAKGNATEYGIVFISETFNRRSIAIDPDIRYIYDNGEYLDDTNNCNFDNENGCSRKWINPNQNSLQTSFYYPFPPLIDERWNSIDIYVTQGEQPVKYSRRYPLPKENFYYGISIRGTKDAQILLCNNDRPRKSKCYWIIIDGFTNFQVTAVRKCVGGVPDTWAMTEDCRQLKNNKTIPEKLLNETRWSHFSLSKENNHIQLRYWDENYNSRLILNYIDEEDEIVPSFMFLRSYDSVAHWKVHEYNYLLLFRKNNQLFQLRSSITFKNSTSVCLSFYVTLCPSCKMKFRLEKEDGSEAIEQEIQGELVEPNVNFYKWMNVRLLGGNSSSDSHIYNLYVSLINEGFTGDFFAIDDIRTCSLNEIRVAKQNSAVKIYCHSLKYNSWRFNVDNQIIDENESPACSNISLIGPHCDISCSSVINVEFCRQYKICLPNEDVTKSGCICSSGYSWNTKCQQKCPYQYYGYECKNTCGKCKYNYDCEKETGKCENGCDDGYAEPYCNQSAFPRLLYAPNVVEVTYTNITLQITNTTTEGDGTPIYYQIECKQEYLAQEWKACSDKLPLSVGSQVTITKLNKETTYLLRAIIYSDTSGSYRNNDVPFVKETTLCKIEKQINIVPNRRSAVISIQTKSEDCELRNYKLRLISSTAEERSLQSVSEITIPNLKPYTKYKINLSYYKSDYVLEKEFTTEQDAPGEIQTVKLIKASDSSLILMWDAPRELNGIIEKYTLSYEFISRIECNGRYKISHKNTTKVLPHEISYFVINNLHPYSKYQITIYAETILPGKEVSNVYETLMREVVMEEELPLSISTHPQSTEVSIQWLLNCESRLGPIYFHFTVTCKDNEWCNGQLNRTTLEKINSMKNGIVIRQLIPYTNYLVDIRIARGVNSDLSDVHQTREFTTFEGIPPTVRNLTVYSKNENIISVRWLKPFPPHGQLEKFTLKYCYTSYYTFCSNDLSFIGSGNKCDLWNEDFYCVTIKALKGGNEYTIYIKAKNKNVQSFGREITTKAITSEGEPTEPLNVTQHWENNELNLFWNHPDITNGILKGFLITLQLNKTEIANPDQEELYIYKHEVTTNKKKYMYQIKKSFRYSTSYVLTICGYTKYLGNNATLLIDTPPETPELTNNVLINPDSITNSTVNIIIPGVKKNTISLNSCMYVVVSKSNKNERKKRNSQVEEKNLKSEILKHANSENAWIAKELDELNENNLEVTVGTGEMKMSNELNEEIVDKPLESSTNYEIYIALINKYRQQRSINIYHIEEIRTADTAAAVSAGLFALLLLLLVPILIFVLYRYYRKKQMKLPSMQSIPGLRRFQSGNTRILEDHHDPDIIPLTGTGTEAQEVKPKKPAIAPKPDSKKKQEVAIIPETSTQETNFFHSRIIPLENYEEYLKEALENGELEQQHALFPRGQTKPWEYGMLQPNKFKNRYNNLIAYDKNRVKLEKINNDQYSDYINASYIHGYRQNKAYIATQGPKFATVNDFWRMIWQEKVHYIVMLANVVEAGKKKCEKYWPDIDSSREFGNIEVYFEKSEIYADFEFRTFEISCKDEKRKITQLHFTSWPDHGVPLYPQSLVPFLKKMLTIPQSTAPVVVHCSAGVGRTGTIILCDICLRMAAREKAVDVLRYLHEIREQRANMVDNIDQYKLVHMVLLECLLAPDTNLPCNLDLPILIQQLIDVGGLQIQLNYLQQSSWQDKALNFTTKKTPDPVNESKNRFNDIVPTENQIYIPRYPVDDATSDYINAIPVDGFRFKEQFIVTQLPLPNTIQDFWRMVVEKSVKIIVSLNDIPLNDQTCCKFWPEENSELQSLPDVLLRYHKLQVLEFYDIHNIVLDNKTTQQCCKIKIVQFKHWKCGESLPENAETFVQLWEEVENLSRGNYPIIVTCYDGATACGLFVTMSFVIEKIKLEQQCDPCLAVRVIRRNRQQFVSTKTQFEFLYRSAVIYLSLFETYSNFQPVISKNAIETHSN